jgi:putative transposase
VSFDFGKKACAAGIAQSLASRSERYDNAVAESFFATLKKELAHRRSWPTKADLRTEIFDYLEVFYNRQRRHTRLGGLSPAGYEQTCPSRDHQEHTAA